MCAPHGTLIGPLPRSRGCASFWIVSIDNFTKWFEAELLAKITKPNTSKFSWKNILCRFKIPHSIASHDGKQFYNKKVRSLCDELGIKKHFFTAHHPQAKGHVEAVTKTIKHILKRKLDTSKWVWVEESFHVNDLVLRRAFLSSKVPKVGSLGPNWEGPYRINEEIHPGHIGLKT